MKKLLLPLIALLGSAAAWAQPQVYYPSSYLRVMSDKDTLENAFTGGLANPMMSNIDLNNDGLKDLFVFDKQDNRVLTFLAVAKGSTRYQYAPHFEEKFPASNACWTYLVDFNGDNKPDLFTNGYEFGDNTSVRVYKNVSTGTEIKFELYTKELLRRNKNGIDRISAGQIENPLFNDLDNDGDLDMITFGSTATQIDFYRNMADTLGRKDTLVMAHCDECFGRFFESASTKGENYLIGVSCGQYNSLPNGRAARHGSGSTLFSMDLDGDGDKDLVVGDAGMAGMANLTNSPRIVSKGLQVDSMTSYQKFFPAGADSVRIPNMPYLSAVDIDNDGDSDIVASPMELSNSLQKNFMWYYENVPNGNVPDFKKRKENFLEGSMLDAGLMSSPAFFDYDGDGIQDLVIGAQTYKKGLNVARLQLYLGKKAANGRPYYTLYDDDYLGLSLESLATIKPVFADMDGDGKQDLIYGSDYGTIAFYKNTSSGSTAAFSLGAEQLQYDKSGLNNIKVAGASLPAAADLDGDGKVDLIIGSGINNRLSYYKGKGLDKGIPVFEHVTDTFGKILLMNGANADKRLSPCISDANGDGKPDLLLGSNGGKLRLYSDIRKGGTLTETPLQIFNHAKKTAEDKTLGYLSAPAVAKIDGDNLPDIIVGNIRGGVYFLNSRDNGPMEFPTASIGRTTAIQSRLNIYPNPAGNVFRMEYENAGVSASGSLTLYDLTGRSVLEKSVRLQSGNGAESLDVSQLPNGVYMLRLQTADQMQQFTGKVVISR